MLNANKCVIIFKNIIVKGGAMENKLAVIAIIVGEFNSVEKVNALLHEYRDYIVGRMGISYREKKVNIISVVIDAPAPEINALSGKIGMIDGVSSKVLTAK